MQQYKYDPYRAVIVILLILLSFSSLVPWLSSPIFPDEVAFRLLSWRYIQDQGVAQKLFYICSSNLREVPLLFVAPAMLFSWLDLHLSLSESRDLPLVSLITAMYVALLFSVNGRNRSAAILVTVALIGVSGSGLIIVRAEYLQIFNIACCILAIFCLQLSVSLGLAVRFGISALLLFSCLLSIYSHIQGLLFLPLTLYLTFRLVGLSINRFYGGILLVGFFLFSVISATRFNAPTSCVKFPGISQAIHSMVFDFKQFDAVSVTDWVATHANKYLSAFYFKDTYQINYLPGIHTDVKWIIDAIWAMNNAIHFILIGNLFLFVLIASGAILFSIYQAIFNRYSCACEAIVGNGLNGAHVVVLYSLPTIFLFFYDANQNFYRSFFINLLVSIMLSMLLSRFNFGRFRLFATAYFFLCGGAVLGSAVVNQWWFSNNFRMGFAGPSIPINSQWDDIAADIISLSKDCDMDLSKGKIIVDDMTYDTLKRFPFLYPITYLDLSGSLSKLTNHEIVNIVRPNYAIVRCDYLNSWGLSPQKRVNQLCGINFLSQNLYMNEK